MTDLVEFLRARLDEDASLAQQALGTPASDVELYGTWPRQRVPFGMTFDPARVLREVEAKRRLIARYERAVAIPESVSGFVRGQDDGYRQACLDAIKDAAEIHADHPDYREEWKP